MSKRPFQSCRSPEGRDGRRKVRSVACLLTRARLQPSDLNGVNFPSREINEALVRQLNLRVSR